MLAAHQFLIPSMRHAQVFISYRRDDAAGYARAIGDALAAHLGADRVFIDVDDIQPGQRFAQVIQREVTDAKVLLVLIGRRWRGERDGAPPRIEEPTDFVRCEVAAGLASTAQVIPVLLDGTTMPAEAQLPADLRALAGRNALTLDNARYADDMSRLLAAVRKALGESTEPANVAVSAGAGRSVRWGAALLLMAAGWAAVDMTGFRPWSKRSPPAVAAPAARPDINGVWQAQVSYDWPNAHYLERFDLRGAATELHGTASFLGVPRGVFEGRVDEGSLHFVTHTTELIDGASHPVVHRYSGRWADQEIRFVMQTEGSSSPHEPVEFIARRVASAPASGDSRP